MNRSKVAILFGQMVSLWKSFDPEKESLKTWGDALKDVDLAQAEAGLKKYAQSGKEFPPNVYQILALLPRKSTKSTDVYSDPVYCRDYLERELNNGMVVCGEMHRSGGFSFRLRRHQPYFDYVGKVILHDVLIDYWRD